MTQRTCRGQHHHSHVDHDHSPRCDVKFSSHHDAANDQNPDAWLFCGYDQQHQSGSVRLCLPPSDSVFLVRTSQLCASCNMEIINNSPETSDYEEEDNVSQARDREVPLQNAELSEEVLNRILQV
ncbi:hypothetical protein P8452_14493 [Trifolium repens]|nr:hypothetical protein P8452_14493 [Trifolium repens]